MSDPLQESIGVPASGSPIIHAVGDTFALYWPLSELKTASRGTIKIKRYAVGPDVGPPLMYTFGKQGLDMLNLPKLQLQDSHILLISFGELDCRCFLGSSEKKGQETDLIDQLVEGYETVLQELREKFPTVKLWIAGVVPPVECPALNTAPSPSRIRGEPFLFVGTTEARLKLVKEVNLKLERMSAHIPNCSFINHFDDYISVDGILKPDLVRNVIHLSRLQPSTLARLEELVEQPLEVVTPSQL